MPFVLIPFSGLLSPFPASDVEMTLLERLVPTKDGSSRKRTVGDFLTRVAKLGGYLNRKRDAPPGNMVL